MQPPITQIGHYRIQEEIGRGGMAVVYRAIDTQTKGVVALKVLPPQLAHDEKYLHRFLREGKNANRLQHPNIVRVLETGSADGHYYMAMQYIDGPTLTDYLRQSKSILPTNEIIALIRQVAGALDYAHDLGFLHRDIKPSNILLDKKGMALLTDFGVAKVVDDEVTAYTVVGTTVGTPAFMSPEQAHGAELDRRSDVYSLGVVAYTMLTGTMPFKAESQPALLHKVAYEQPTPPEQLNPAIPPGIVYAIKRVLAKSPSVRYPTAGAFAEALGAGVTWKPSTNEWQLLQKQSSPSTPVQAIVTGEPTKKRSLPALAWLAILLLFVGAGALFVVRPNWLPIGLMPAVPAAETPPDSMAQGAAAVALIRFKPGDGTYELEVPADWAPKSQAARDWILETFDAPDRIARYFVLRTIAAQGQPAPPIEQFVRDFLARSDTPYRNPVAAKAPQKTELASRQALQQTLQATWLGRPVTLELMAADVGTTRFMLGSVMESSQAALLAPVSAAVFGSFQPGAQFPATASEPGDVTAVATDTPPPTNTATLQPTDTPMPDQDPAVLPDTPVAPTMESAGTDSTPVLLTATPQPVPPTNTEVPTAVPTSTQPPPSSTPTADQQAKSTETSTATSSATSTPIPTGIPVPAAAATSTAPATVTRTPTSTAMPTATPNAGATQTALANQLSTAVAQTLTALPPAPTSTPIPTATSLPTLTATATVRPTATATSLPPPTSTPLPTSTPVPTSTPIPTSTPLPTSTATAIETPNRVATLAAMRAELTRMAATAVPTPTPNLPATLEAMKAELTRMASTPMPEN